jgi:hypothetical protein
MTLTRRETIGADTILNQIVRDESVEAEDSSSSLEDEIMHDELHTSTAPLLASPYNQGHNQDDSIHLSALNANEFDSFLSSNNLDLHDIEYHKGDMFAVDYTAEASHHGFTMQQQQQQQQTPETLPPSTVSSVNRIDFVLPPVASAEQGATEAKPPAKFVLSIIDPSSEVVKDVLGVLIDYKVRFVSEMQGMD